MNLLPLFAALLPWATSPADALTRIIAAISLLSIEMQIATLTGLGHLRSVALLNLGVSATAAILQWRSRRLDFAGMRAAGRVVPLPAVLTIAAVVAVLGLRRPAEAADPYNMQRIEYIAQAGTIAHVPDGDPKMNILGFVYELVLADLAITPAVGDWLLRAHGLFGVGLVLLGAATVRQWTNVAVPAWMWLSLVLVPVVFNQLVLIKNDLFLAVPAFVALYWLIARAREGHRGETIRAAWLIGLVAGCKPTSLPLAMFLSVGVLILQRPRIARTLAWLVVGGVAGALASGIFFTLSENARVYGDSLAVAQAADIGAIGGTPAAMAASVMRFSISLFDLGLLTRRWWPGRGGWGGTFGLPFIWALAVLLASLRRSPEAKWVLAIAAAYFLIFAATFADADVAHRLTLAPALLVISYAVVTAAERPRRAWPQRLLVPVLVLAAAQVARSATLYLAR